jgi:hypothetical protein
MVFKHGDRIKRRTQVRDLYIYGIYLGTVQDINQQPLCLCINPEITESYFLARPEDLQPLDVTPTSKHQLPLVNSKY